ncbi:MAG: alpha/beta hydrolase [Nitrospirota bacterium]
MKLDLTIHKGNPDKPVVIFVHGLGVDKKFWTDPADSKVMGRNIPMKIFAAVKPEAHPVKPGKINISAGDVPEKIDNLWTAVINRGFNAVCWSQSRPVGPIDVAVRELEKVMEKVRMNFPGKTAAIVCHSRGGLIARKFMERKVPEIKAMITISSPHAGSSLSRLGKYLYPLLPFLKKTLPQETHGTISKTLKRIHDLLDGNALKELLPDSDFIKNLKDPPSEDILYLSFGGTEAKLLTIYKMKKSDSRFYPKPLLDIPDSLLKHLPASIIPKEVVTGKGDFLVTAESSVLPLAQKHYNLPENHLSISWNKKMIAETLELLEKI